MDDEKLQEVKENVQDAKDIAKAGAKAAAGDYAGAAKDAAKKLAKETASAIKDPKKAAKKAGKKILAAMTPIIAVILIGILFFATILAAAELIKEKIAEIKDKITGWMNHIVDGIIYGDGIVVDDDEVDEFIEELEAQGVSLADMGFGASDEDIKNEEDYENLSKKEKEKKKARKYIKKFMEAALVTQTVWTDDTGISGIAGGIKLIREDAKTGESTSLSLGDSLGAGDYEHYQLGGDGKIIINSKAGGQITIDTSAYEQYTLPIMYFVDLCLLTQNPKYVEAIADGIINRTLGSTTTSSGTQTSGTGSVDSDGYSQKVIFNGVEYKEYKQNSSIWGSHTYWGDGTIAGDGCGPTSIAVILSGFKEYVNYTPDKVADGMSSTGSGTISQRLSSLGINNNIISSPTSYDVVTALNAGHPLIVSLNAGVPSDGGSQFTGSRSGHISAILGIDGDNVYVSNVYNSTNMRTGWVPLSIVMEKCGYIIDITSTPDNIANEGGTSSTTSLDNFLIIGDSRIEQIETQLRELGNNVTAIGVGYSTPANWVNVTKNGSGSVPKGNTTYAPKSVTLPDSVDGVCIMLGTNGTLQYSEMKEVLNNLHNRYPNVTIYVDSVYHLSQAYNSYGGSVIQNNNIDNFNNEMEAFCNETSWAKYVDISAGLHDDNGFLKAEYADASGIHIVSTEGIEIIVNNIKNGVLGGTSNRGTNLATGSLGGHSGYWMVIKVLDSCTQINKDITYWITDPETNETTIENISSEEISYSTSYYLTEVNHLLFRMRQTYTRTDTGNNSITTWGGSGNGSSKIVTTTRSWGFTTPIQQDPVILCEEEDFFVKASKTKYKIPNSGEKIRAYDSFKDGGEMLFTIMDRTIDNELLIQVTKYVFYKMLGIDFGVTELNFSSFSFSKIASAEGLIGWHWTCLHENGAMWLYMHDVDTDYNKYYVKNYVSQDKTTYYMHGDGTNNGSMNFGYGVCIYAFGNWMPHTFANYGINIYDSQYHSFWTSTMPVEIVDQVSQEEWLYWRENYVIPWVERAGIQLEEYQLDCLTDMCYQNSNYALQVIRNYKVYGLSESLRSSCTAFNSWGTRADDRWALFSRGEYNCSSVNYILNPEDFKGEDEENGSNSSEGTTAPTTSSTATGPNGYVHPCPTASYISNYPGAHKGYDFAASQGTPVYAVTSGKVYYYQYYDTRTRKLVSYGNWCQLVADDGKSIIYAHLRDFYGVELSIPYTSSAGYPSSWNSYTGRIGLGSKSVQKGDLIGYVGTTGNSTGPHLHFEINGISNSSYAYKQYIPSPN